MNSTARIEEWESNIIVLEDKEFHWALRYEYDFEM